MSKQQVKTNSSKDKKFVRLNGLQKLKDIVNALDPSFKKKILDELEKTEPVIAKFLEFYSHDFSVILRLDGTSVQRLIVRVADRNWVEAIGFASEDVKNYILSQISTSRREDWLEQLGQIAKSQSPEVCKLASIKSQNLILGQMHKLFAKGQIRFRARPSK